MTPRIVVGMAVFNESPYLAETIPAILAQSMSDFALLILDNGSTDDSARILGDFAARDPRITLLHSPQNLWPPVAANRCWPLAMARWPATRWFLGAGADDRAEPGYLDAILAAADAHPDANCIFAPRQWIDHPERGVQPWPAYDPETVHADVQIPAWRAVTRELWEQVGPEDTTIRIGADWDWAVRAAAKGVLRPYQLERALLSLRVRGPDRPSQSDEVDWPALHRHLCGVIGKPVPVWAKARRA